MKHFHRFALLVAAASVAAHATAKPVSVDCPSGMRVVGTTPGVYRAFAQARPYLDRLTKRENLRKRPYGIYPLQVTTANVMRYAEKTHDARLLRELIPYYERALAARTVQSRVAEFYVRGHDGRAPRLSVVNLPHPLAIWRRPDEKVRGVAAEYVLPAAQFLYATLRLMRTGAEIAPDDPDVRRFTRDHAEEIVSDTLLRWIDGPSPSFSRHSWGCDAFAETHRALIEQLKHRAIAPAANYENKRALCNAVTDVDLFVIGSAAEALLLDHNEAKPFLRDDQRKALISDVRDGAALMKRRHVVFGRNKNWAVFDPGSYDVHPDYRYAGHTVFERSCFACRFGDCRNVCETFPTQRADSTPPPTGLGWDLSHARRLPLIYDSMRRVRKLSGAAFPTRDNEAQLARQFSQVVWNGDKDNPVFANFYDGTNGWYRVDYGGRKGFGYAPGSFVMDVASFGYSFWAPLDKHVATALRAAVTAGRTAVCTWLDGSPARALMLAPELVNIAP